MADQSAHWKGYELRGIPLKPEILSSINTRWFLRDEGNVPVKMRMCMIRFPYNRFRLSGHSCHLEKL